jgi:hypothetical protein
MAMRALGKKITVGTFVIATATACVIAVMVLQMSW